MNIRVHMPSTTGGWEELNNRLAEHQSEFIINEINKIPCDYEGKLVVLAGVIRKINNM